MDSNQYTILKPTGSVNLQIPVFLDASADEYGVMVDFDGDIEQMEQLCNFTYTATGNVITVCNTANTNKINKVVHATFTVNFGDGSPSQSLNIWGCINHTYAHSGAYNVSITMNAPWTVQTTSKKITLPLFTGIASNPLGTLTFTVPYSVATHNQNYINDFDYATGHTGTTIVLGLGTSRIGELKLYGSANSYTGITTGSTVIDGTTYTYSGYTLDGLFYRDLSDGSTYISGNTANYPAEFIIDGMLSRNEHFLGFVDDPVIYSDIFVERGKQGVSEYNLRLSEIGSTADLEIYENGFFKVQKQ
jgi:hypothetical protein